jgi:hypothetical protein
VVVAVVSVVIVEVSAVVAVEAVVVSAVVVEVAAVLLEVVVVLLEVEEVPLAVVVEVLEVVPEVVPRSSSNLIVMKASSLPVERKIFSSPRTWFLANPSTVKSASLSTTLTEPRLTTVSGILSDPSWALVFWVVWTTFTLLLARRSFTWVLPAVPLSPTCPILLVLKALCTLSNSLTVPAVI